MPEATIDISGNHFEYSANAIRIGFVGSPSCTINIFNNTYDETDTENPKWAGLLLIQPYGKQTISFGDLKVYLKRNRCTKKGTKYQDWYLYCNESDTQITGELYPQVYIDGILQEEPVVEITE